MSVSTVKSTGVRESINLEAKQFLMSFYYSSQSSSSSKTLLVMSGRCQTTLILMLITVAALSEAKTINRLSDSSNTANYIFGLHKQLKQRALENCPTCPDCPAPSICTACPHLISTSSFSICPAAGSYEKTFAREGVIDLSALKLEDTCNFVILTLSPYTKVRVKCPATSQNLGVVGGVQAYTFDPLSILDIGTKVNEEYLSSTYGAFLQIKNQQAFGSVRCTWSAE